MAEGVITEDELQSLLEHAVDAGWADQLVRALELIADGRKHPQEIAIRALQKAGLWPPRQLQWWDGAGSGDNDARTNPDPRFVGSGLLG